MKLPKTKKVTKESQLRPKILLLSDDLTCHSGVGTMSREIVMNTLDRFQWVQLAALKKHPKHGQVLDLSSYALEETDVRDPYLKLYANSGYGNQDLLRQIIQIEQPDVILHFTDPRFWDWLYAMEYELKHEYEIPLAYYSIWDNYPIPYYNIHSYGSCDLLIAINRQTHKFHREVLNHFDIETFDRTKDKGFPRGTFLDYVPHGVDPDVFRPITKKSDPDYKNFQIFKKNFEKTYGTGPVYFWNNRNIQRKHPATVIEALSLLNLKAFHVEPILLMHTDPYDPNGTNLIELAKVVAPNCNIVFSTEDVPKEHLNYFYNLAIATINIASNEGFGLSSLESIMAGTPVINNMTGGLKDQAYMVDENGEYNELGKWCYPVYPSNSAIQGSLSTPYIKDDRVSAEDVADSMKNVFIDNYSPEEDIRTLGREWAINEVGMTSKKMAERIGEALLFLINNWQRKNKVTLTKIGNFKDIKQ